MNSITGVYIGNRRSKLLQFKYDDNKLREKLRTWKCLQSHIPREKATDCVVSSLHFMDIIAERKFAEDSSQYLTDFKSGVTDDEIVNEMFKYFGNQHGFSEYNYDESNPDPYQKWIDILNRELKKEHLTMVLLKQTHSGHAVIIYKDKDNQLHLIDSQQLTIDSTDRAISDYFKSDNYIKLSLIQTPIKRALSPNAFGLRKTKLANQHISKRTTRRSRSPDSMSISPKRVISPINKRKRKRTETIKIRKNKRQSGSPDTKKARVK